VAVRICSTPATHNPALAGLKHLNRLDSVLARAEWSETEIAEGLMAGPEGDIVGGTMSNLFLWDGSRLLTPKVDRCGIAGTVRALTMELAANRGIPCLEARLSLTDLLTGRGLFLTNSLLGVWPVRRLDRRAYDPGELPLQLIGAVRRQAQTPEVPGP
jgi:4-amino-4-deoxychorismate lyase